MESEKKRDPTAAGRKGFDPLVLPDFDSRPLLRMIGSFTLRCLGTYYSLIQELSSFSILRGIRYCLFFWLRPHPFLRRTGADCGLSRAVGA